MFLKMFKLFFAAFSLKMCLVICGRRQAVDHLGADLIFDLVLETVLLRTSNCISPVFLLYFSCIPASLYCGVALLLVSDCFIARLLGGGFTRLLSRRWWCTYVQCNVGFFANMREHICSLIFANGFFSNMRKFCLANIANLFENKKQGQKMFCHGLLCLCQRGLRYNLSLMWSNQKIKYIRSFQKWIS